MNTIKEDINKYRWWDILDDLPEGWLIDKTAGAPAPNTVFITNGKSVVNGQKRALLRLKKKQDINTTEKETPETDHFREVRKKVEEDDSDISILETTAPDGKKVEEETPIFPAKTVNDLARLKFKEQLLKEIMFDLQVCEIENWDKKEYINELKKMLNSIDTTNKKKVTTQNLPNLFSSVDF